MDTRTGEYYTEAEVRAMPPEERIHMQPVRVVQRETRKVGRNELCPCGSGKKFKRCHWMQPAEQA